MFDISDEAHDPSDDATPRPRSIWRWMTPILGLIVFELTLDPMLGAILACLRFGERDFATAIWLLRRDANRLRAWACATTHVCCGLAWVGVLGIGVAMVGAVLITSLGRLLPAVMMRQGLGISLAAFFAVPLYSLVSLVLVATALAGRVKVWASATNHQACRLGRWPPLPDHEVNWAANRVQSVVVFAFILVPVSLIVPWSILLRAGANGQPPEEPHPVVFVVGIFAAIAYLRLAAWVAVRIAAREPRECWPEGEIDTIDSVP